uniref:ShKT domain-containing protein n=1 Tax=Acrobeloides nanus TaxID=290746 RepID=A0A914DNB1_9BILA
MYKTLMLDLCPATCGFCQVTTAKPDEELEENNVRGAPENDCFDLDLYCTKRSHLCNSQLYKAIMAKECALTCGYCTPPPEEE